MQYTGGLYLYQTVCLSHYSYHFSHSDHLFFRPPLKLLCRPVMDRLSFFLNWNFIVDTLWTAHHRSAESFRHISLDSTSIFLSADLYCHKPLNLASIFRRLFHGFSRRIFIRRVHLPLHLSVKLLSRPAFTLTLYWNLPHSSFSIATAKCCYRSCCNLYNEMFIYYDVYTIRK